MRCPPRRRAAPALSDRVRFELRDYREHTDRYDRIVSVGMFEHVGVGHYGEFFAKINELLTDDGVMLLHSIGHMSPPGTASPWLRKYIFPGAYSPALSEVFEVVEQHSLWVTDLEFLRVHYAKTLHHWWRALRGQPRQDRGHVRRALLPHVGVLPDQRGGHVPHRQPDGLPHAARPPARRGADRARLHHRRCSAATSRSRPERMHLPANAELPPEVEVLD